MNIKIKLLCQVFFLLAASSCITPQEAVNNNLNENDWGGINIRGISGNRTIVDGRIAIPNDLYFKNRQSEAIPDGYPMDTDLFMRNHDTNICIRLLGSEIAIHQKDSLSLICFLKKTFEFNDKIYNLYDSVMVNLKDTNISKIWSGIYSKDSNMSMIRIMSYGERNNSPSENPKQTEDSEEVLMASAAYYYDCGKYDEARLQYEKIVEKYLHNDDAWYYLGVMYFKGQGTGNRSKKQRLEKAVECWKNSNCKKASNALKYITDGREE